MNAKIFVMDVNPKIASEWLDNPFRGQRKIRDSHVARLATEIISGRWKLSSDAIVLINGKLGNGQHRCSAIVMANRTCKCLVMETRDEELFQIIDCGIKRTEADVINESLKNTNHSIIIASAVRLVLNYQKSFLTPLGKTIKRFDKSQQFNTSILTRGEIIEYARANTDRLIEFADMVDKLYREQTILPKSMSCAFLELASSKNYSKAIEFIKSVYRGDKQDASYDLRERLFKNKTSKAKLHASYIFGLLIKSFKAYLNNERLGVLKILDGEQYPIL